MTMTGSQWGGRTAVSEYAHTGYQCKSNNYSLIIATVSTSRIVHSIDKECLLEPSQSHNGENDRYISSPPSYHRQSLPQSLVTASCNLFAPPSHLHSQPTPLQIHLKIIVINICLPGAEAASPYPGVTDNASKINSAVTLVPSRALLCWDRNLGGGDVAASGLCEW